MVRLKITEITVSCAEGDQGYVYDGIAQVEVEEVRPEALPTTQTRVMLIQANPAEALRWWRLPADGIGLARMEFIIGSLIRVHPMALVQWQRIRDRSVRQQIEELTVGYSDKTEYFVDTLAHGIARIAAASFPKPVIVRSSDFKSNEYANLIGGAQFEPSEENPMLGFRGATRYASDRYRDGFAPECRALKRARDELGLSNIVVMIPFCRTPAEADQVLDVLADNGLVRGINGLKVYVMCEIPSNVILAEAFAAAPFRRLLDRQQRPDPTRAGRRPGLRDARAAVRRARRGGGDTDSGCDRARSPLRPRGGAMRPGPERLPRACPLAGRGRHRLDLGHPG
jgi:pyruvate,water dikinase